jgi:hypothetical protein
VHGHQEPAFLLGRFGRPGPPHTRRKWPSNAPGEDPNGSRPNTKELGCFLKRHLGGQTVDNQLDLRRGWVPAAADFLLHAGPSPWRLPIDERVTGYRCAGSGADGLGAADGTELPAGAL